MLQARRDKTVFRRWMEFGGIVTLDAYGDTGRASLIPSSHFEFLASCVPFYETPTHVFTRRELEEKLYGWGDEVGSNTIEVHVHGLRRKIGAQHIVTVRGVGYRMARVE